MAIKLTVLMSCYNASRYVEKAVLSILNQSFGDFEFIIINDGSKDNTIEIVRSFNDSRIKIIDQENKGLADSLNIGIHQSKGDYIARMDADDISLPNRFSKQLKVLEENPEIVAVGSNAHVIDEHSEFIYNTNLPLNWPEIQNALPNTPFIHPSVMFRKDAVVEIGGYPNIPVGQDLLLFNKLVCKGEYKNIKSPLIKYRIHPHAVSRKSKKTARIVRKLLRNYLESGSLDQEMLQELDESLVKEPEKRYYFYHLLLAKKYLWNNYNLEKSRSHLKKARQEMKNNFYLEPLTLHFLSCLGKNMITGIYKYVKR